MAKPKKTGRVSKAITAAKRTSNLPNGGPVSQAKAAMCKLLEPPK